MNKFSQAVEKLKELHGSIRRNEREAGRVIVEFLGASKKPEREKLLGKLCKAAGISRATAFNYMKAFRDFEKLPKFIVERAEATFGKITRPLREALIEVHAEHPKASAANVIKMTEQELKQAKGRADEQELTAQQRQDRLFEFAAKLYNNVIPEVRDAELRQLADRLIDQFRLDEPEAIEAA